MRILHLVFFFLCSLSGIAQHRVQQFEKDGWLLQVKSNIDLRKSACLFLHGKYELQLAATFLQSPRQLQVRAQGCKLEKVNENHFSLFPQKKSCVLFVIIPASEKLDTLFRWRFRTCELPEPELILRASSGQFSAEGYPLFDRNDTLFLYYKLKPLVTQANFSIHIEEVDVLYQGTLCVPRVLAKLQPDSLDRIFIRDINTLQNLGKAKLYLQISRQSLLCPDGSIQSYELSPLRQTRIIYFSGINR